MTNDELFYQWWDSDDSDSVRVEFSMDDAKPIWDAALKLAEGQKPSTNSAMDEIAANLRGINLSLLSAYDLKGTVQRIKNCLRLLHQ